MLVNFSWIRAGKVAGMGMPYANAWDALRQEGIGAVLTLTERAPVGDPEAAGLRKLHVPLVDFGTPSLEDLDRCVTWIDEQLAEGRAVVVHCFAGLGRTGTVLAAWLVREGLKPEAAVAEIRRLRPGSLETGGQVDAVRRFAAEGQA